MTNETENRRLNELTSFIDPTSDSPDTVSINEETLKKILKYIAEDRQLEQERVHKIVDKYFELIKALKNGGDIRAILNAILGEIGCSPLEDRDLEGIRGSPDFVRIALTLKTLAGRLSSKCRSKEVSKKYGQIKFLFDTCYNDKKAERLEKALKEIMSRLNNDRDLFKKFLVLFAAVLARSTKDYDYFLRSEWFLLLVRAAAGAVDDRNKFIPVCPTKGDVAIIIVYAIITNDVPNNDIRKSDVEEIIKKLVKLA